MDRSIAIFNDKKYTADYSVKEGEINKIFLFSNKKENGFIFIRSAFNKKIYKREVKIYDFISYSLLEHKEKIRRAIAPSYQLKISLKNRRRIAKIINPKLVNEKNKSVFLLYIKRVIS